MKPILIGRSTGPNSRNIHFDTDVLLTTRLLVCANSGGGKSWLLRRLAEQLNSVMPHMIIDPEGEFATLREQFNFVLVGKGGDTPADFRAAKLLMHRLLELRASAVFDLSELSIPERHHYVKLISEAAINSPKELWRPTAFTFDEVHDFCPENGKGNSEAKNAVLGFPTKGRKRGFLSIFATQRVHKLALDARAEMMNRMIGQTFEPDDIKVAASILGIDRGADMDEFKKTLRTMEPGMFYTFGRAVSTEHLLVKVGPVETSHEIGDSKFGHVAPPAPDKIKKLLPSLADLPQKAREVEQTVTALRAEVHRLEIANRAIAVAERPEPAKTKLVEKPAFSVEQSKRLTKLSTEFDALVKIAQDTGLVTIAINQRLGQIQPQIGKLKDDIEMIKSGILPPVATSMVVSGVPRVKTARLVYSETPDQVYAAPKQDAGDPNEALSKCERAILTACAEYPEGRTDIQISALTQYAKTSGSFRNSLGSLRSKGFIQRGQPNKITPAGLAKLGPFEPLPKGKELRELWLNQSTKCEAEILRQLFAIYPDGMTQDRLADATGYQVTSGSFRNSLGRLRTLELIDRGQPIYAGKHLFLE